MLDSDVDVGIDINKNGRVAMTIAQE